MAVVAYADGRLFRMCTNPQDGRAKEHLVSVVACKRGRLCRICAEPLDRWAKGHLVAIVADLDRRLVISTVY